MNPEERLNEAEAEAEEPLEDLETTESDADAAEVKGGRGNDIEVNSWSFGTSQP